MFGHHQNKTFNVLTPTYAMKVLLLTLVELVGITLLFFPKLNFCPEFIANASRMVLLKNECCLGGKGKLITECKQTKMQLTSGGK